MKPPMTALHKLDHISTNYIDDLILQGRTYTDCVHNVIDTVSQLEPLGFVIHPDKAGIDRSRICYKHSHHDNLLDR